LDDSKKNLRLNSKKNANWIEVEKFYQEKHGKLQPNINIVQEVFVALNGKDRRVKIHKNGSWFNPSKCIGQLFMKFSKTKKWSCGTAFIFHVDKKNREIYLLTAAHNVIKNGEHLQHLDFESRENTENGSKLLHKYKIIKYCVHPEYIKTNFDSEKGYDLAILIMRDEKHYYSSHNNAHIPVLSALIGEDFEKIQKHDIKVIGFPGEKNGEIWGMKGTQDNSNDSIVIDSNNVIRYNNIDTTRGQSGSPIILNDNKSIIGIHVAGNDQSYTNYGTLLTIEKYIWISDIVTDHVKIHH